ncbi:uncharacterized protein VICG_01831 [Vittaforma corneae ATCC 50505]|uniref:Uncharacterized protein n=1 Tax=Vittaforma corneae (strain ATCC 50505) TaxID=993615 RepID=L2GLI4_VITCO|nr:uncharacterized protein VICG_01831 [Vittaforma corneae ATCC 50505]ELA41132.1 hypothetical protein VICG_01831 [Vittaforma corneae ATCC 50505]
MTLQDFIERNLLKTVEFLIKHKLVEDEQYGICLDSIVSIINANNKEFYKTYSQLLCEQSRKNINAIVFCSCCNSKRIFLRNHSLIHSVFSSRSLTSISPSIEDVKHDFNIVAMPGSKTDPFLKYIKAYISKDIDLAIEVVEEQPLFWEAHLLLMDLCTSFIQINTPLSLYFYAYLKIYKDIDSIEASLVRDSAPCSNKSVGMAKFTVQNANILAALHYCYGDDKKALKIFKTIDFTECFDPSFFEFYGILLYNSNDPSLPLLCENMSNFHKNRYETFTTVGMFKLSQGRFTEARDLFKKAYKLSNPPMLHVS